VCEADEVEELIQPPVCSLVSETLLDQVEALLQNGAVWLVAPAWSVFPIFPQEEEVE
jgi:hypothetical protein